MAIAAETLVPPDADAAVAISHAIGGCSCGAKFFTHDDFEAHEDACPFPRCTTCDDTGEVDNSSGDYIGTRQCPDCRNDDYPEDL